MYIEARHLYEPPQEGWLRWAALAAVLAGLLAAAAFWGAAWWGAKAHQAQREEQQHWRDYHLLALRLEGVKQGRDFFSLQRLLEHKNVKVQKLVEGKLQDFEEEFSRLEKEREQVRAAAEEAGRRSEDKARYARKAWHGAWLFTLGVLLALGALATHKKLLWLAAPLPVLAALALFLVT
uniref:DUF4337 family protein n=1 Tax=Desulfobacca acetoxidans TaxID=60893 RepID=A0A7V4G7A8_9BACT